MSAVLSLAPPRDAYRDDQVSGLPDAARGHLEAASDALSMALLTLSGGDDDDRGNLWRRTAQARGFLAEAVTALSRARIYVRGIRTHAVPVLLAAQTTPEAELQRLHQIATRLLWQNHMYLPARLQATPLPPEEEAQLALVLAGLARSNRIERVLRYKWSALGVAVASASALVGLPALGLAAGAAALTSGVLQAIRHRRAAPALPAE